MKPMDAIVECREVWKSFGPQTVLHGVSFRARPGRNLCIMGASGGGKTTLLKILIGALRPDRGEVAIDGTQIAHLADAQLDLVRRKFGVMFQGGALLNSLTVAENIALPLQHHTRLDADTIRTMVKIKLHQVDLLAAADKLPADLSGGMLKRASVARALALDPKILFYDEPESGLDPVATSRVDQLINQMRDTMGITNIVVTHTLDSVRRIADHVLLLDQGRVLLDGTVQDLEQSDEPRVRRFRTGELEREEGSSARVQSYYKDLLL
ncbi:MAG TPA: ATP-binding cassette domain-containing protein [Planctomycetota bacterium]